MKIYELTFILDPNLDDTGIQAEIDKVTGRIKSSQGEVFEVQHLGKKRMTFEINKNRQGNYYSIYYVGASTIPKEIETDMKLNENILRAMTIVLSSKEYKKPEPEEKPEPVAAAEPVKPEPPEEVPAEKPVDDDSEKA